MTEFNPYAPPESDLPEVVLQEIHDDRCWREGRLLVMSRYADLPDRCVKCNRPASGYRLRRKLVWHHPAWYLFILLHILIYAIIALCVRQTAWVTFGLCPLHRSRRRRTIALGWLLGLMGVGLLVLAGMYPEPPAVVWCVGLGFLAILAGAFFGSRAAQVVAPKKIDPDFVWLAKVSPTFLAPFPSRLG